MSGSLSPVTEPSTTNAETAAGGLVSKMLLFFHSNRDRSPVVAFIADNAQKLFKYAIVGAVGVPVGLLVLFILLRAFPAWPEWQANLVAGLIMVTPNYLMNRYWVWEKNDANRFMGEILPFLVMAIIGMFVSTVAVWALPGDEPHDLLVLFTNLVSFGMVWVAKFFVLDNVLFGRS